MSGSDQSEDGQVLSSGDFSAGEEETTDSLDIKPPPPTSGGYYAKRKEKKSKHSREHHRHSGSGSREPYAESRRDFRAHRDRERDRYQKGMRPEKSRERGHERDRYHGSSGHHSREVRYEMNPFYGEMRETYVSKKEREREYYEKERERRKDGNEKQDADKLLEDLRTRLLHKKSKHDSDKKQQQDQPMYDEEGWKEKRHHRHRRHEHREQSEAEYVEIMESPEYEAEFSKKVTTEVKDKGHDERRAKLLEAERQMARRKEAARDELEVRRLMRRERKNTTAPSTSPDEKKSKKLLDHDVEMESGDEGKKKRKKSKVARRAGSEQSDKEGIADEEEDDTNTDSSSSSSESEDSRDASEEDEKPPGSPLSVGDLAKSDRADRSNSRSRSGSRYRSRSRSTRSRSGSESSRSRSRSPRRRHESSRSVSPRSDTETEAKQKLKENDEPKSPIEIAEEEQLPPYLPGIQGCRSVEEFQCLNRIEEGTYGVVYRAKDKRTEEIVALKRLKMEKEKEGFPITSLREINTLLKGQHPNIVTVREIVVGSNMDKIFIVMDYVEHDLKSLMETMKHKKQVFLPGEVKCLTQQLLKAVAHLHDNWILHRDLKTSNLLLSHKGILKVGDFGLAREYGSPLKAYTSVVVTLWYRAPELLLCCKEYSTPIDIWSVGCIFAEFLSMAALFPGKTELDQLNRIFKELGTPNEKIWPGYNQLPAVQKMTFTEYPVSNLRKRFAHQTSELGISLLQGLLTFDPKQRLTAESALKHSYFKELPLPIDPAMFPTWPAKSELGLKKALASSPKPPSGGGEFKKLGDDAVADNPGFHLGGTYAESRQMAMGPGFSLKF
ncbi:serine/threonine-protein kinase PITSLRE [Toxorhynchites rutilus septentrionalis]|uniref:serine/threonine-protein kinase PITSLRE n=1 Tax=Toxorhynchites rutilus septentrionalis TaxID=329112 RepID=UPI002479F2ED|nr:serine/threonine-protein kinase PITSLRE [Toxorhynchites rutilus septentrionalis]